MFNVPISNSMIAQSEIKLLLLLLRDHGGVRHLLEAVDRVLLLQEVAHVEGRLAAEEVVVAAVAVEVPDGAGGVHLEDAHRLVHKVGH